MEALWDGTIDEWTEHVRPRSERPRRGRRGRADAAEAAEAEAAEAARSAGDDGELTVTRTSGILEPEGTVAPTPAPGIAGLEVEVVRSTKRRKSVSARVEGGKIVVRMPQWMTKAQEAEYVASLVAKLERQHTAKSVDLPTRAAELGVRYGLPRPTSIRWVSNQTQRWGSCTPSTGEIRISDRIAGFPGWVLDAVIVHELAHLVHLEHSAEFWELANRYPKAERAYGFLIAKHLADDEVESG